MTREDRTRNSDSMKRVEDVYDHLKAIESKIDGLVPHVLQLENAAILIVGLIVLLQIIGTLWIANPEAELTRIYWFVPYAMLLLVGRVIKIRNPYNKLAEVIETGFNYAGAGALAGGSVTGLLSGGLGAPAGAAIGGAFGFLSGVAVGVLKAKGKGRGPDLVPCQACGKQIYRKDRYCEGCGEEQTSKSIACPNCGNEVSARARFCPRCGKELEEER